VAQSGCQKTSKITLLLDEIGKQEKVAVSKEEVEESAKKHRQDRHFRGAAGGS